MVATSRASATRSRSPASACLRRSCSNQAELPAPATARAGAPFAGGATRIGGPMTLPERRSILVAVPRAASVTNSVPAGPSQPPGLAGDPDRLPGGSKRSRVEPADLTARHGRRTRRSLRNDDPGRKASDMDAADESRGVDPQHVPVLRLGCPDVSGARHQAQRLPFRQPNRSGSRLRAFADRGGGAPPVRTATPTDPFRSAPAARPRARLPALEDPVRAPVKRLDQVRSRAAAVGLDGDEQPLAHVGERGGGSGERDALERGARSQVETQKRPVANGAAGIRDGEPEGIVACGHQARTPGCVQRRRHAARRHGSPSTDAWRGERTLRRRRLPTRGRPRSAAGGSQDHVCLATRDIQRRAPIPGKTLNRAGRGVRRCMVCRHAC